MLRVRTASFDDAGAICQLNGRNGMGNLDPALWRELWEAYPFESEYPDAPIGWVLETEEGAIVGKLDNIHMLYELAGRRIKGAIASEWAVDEEYRGKSLQSLQLMTAFFRQKDIELWMNASANPTAAKVMTALKIGRIPIPDYGSPCFWAVHPGAFAKAALVRRSIPGASLLAWPLGMALWARDVCLSSGRGRATSDVRRLEQFDERFDEFWRGISASSTRLRAVRTRAVLEWRFRLELRSKRAVIVTAERAGKLLGYAILLRRDGSDLGMDLYDVADLQVEGDDASVIHDLLVGSIKIAREKGADAVKFVSGTPVKRAPAVALRPYTYEMPFWQQYFKASAALAPELATADAWDFSLFDTF